MATDSRLRCLRRHCHHHSRRSHPRSFGHHHRHHHQWESECFTYLRSNTLICLFSCVLLLFLLNSLHLPTSNAEAVCAQSAAVFC